MPDRHRNAQSQDTGNMRAAVHGVKPGLCCVKIMYYYRQF